MNRSTILILTNNTNYWHNIRPKLPLHYQVIIQNENTNLSILNAINIIDCLIIHNLPTSEHFGLIQAISSRSSIKSIYVIPPDYSEHQLIEGIKLLALSRNRTVCTTSTDKYEISKTPPAALDGATPYTDPSILHLSGFMLGSFSVLVNGLGIHEWHGRKAKSLLAYLLYNRKFANSREVIMDKFWPNVSPQAARNSLNGIIHKIRRMLKCLDPTREYILYKDDSYVLNPELTINLDYEKFLDSYRIAQRLEHQNSIATAVPYYEEATRHYKGDFLEENRYDEWTYSERESFKQKYLHAMDRLSYHYLSCKKYLLAQQYCRKMLEKDDCLEEIHRRLMTCLHMNGYRDLAVKQFYKCADSLEKGLDIKPGQATIDLLNNIKYN